MGGLCRLAGSRHNPSPGPFRLGLRRGRGRGPRTLDRLQLPKPGFAQRRRTGVLGTLHPNTSRSEALALRQMGEAAYNEDRLDRAKE